MFSWGGFVATDEIFFTTLTRLFVKKLVILPSFPWQ